MTIIIFISGIRLLMPADRAGYFLIAPAKRVESGYREAIAAFSRGVMAAKSGSTQCAAEIEA